MARNSIGNAPHPRVLAPILLDGKAFNVSPMGKRLPSASFWGRPGGANPYETLSDLNRACLSDEDRVTLADAQYVIFSTLTPVAWKMADGRWMVPAYEYSLFIDKHVCAALSALSWNDVRAENGNLLQP